MTLKLSSDLSGNMLNDRYLVQKKIGVGGFATVYRAWDTRLDCVVAIKVLHPEHTRNIADVERFQREAKIAGVIKDDHFVKVTDFIADGEHFCFVMEHLEGLTLREELQRLSGKIMSWPRAFKIARQLCAGLGAAHARGLIHRDIKPENIFLKRASEGGQVKVLDLGVAKILEEHNLPGLYKNLSNTGDIIGSPCYIAPEQVRGERNLDARVDIYALGVVLYEMVAGRVPFRGQTAFETMEHHVRTEPTRPTILVPELRIPRQIEELILRALQKAPRDRYRSAQEMDAAIRNELENRSDMRRVRSVQFIQVASEFAWDGAAPVTLTTSKILEDGNEPTTAKRSNGGGVPPSAGQTPLGEQASPGPGPAVVPGQTDITPAPENARGATPVAQALPTSPDIALDPPASVPPVTVPQVRPLRLRTMIMLGAFAAASLLATCSVGTVLALAIDSRNAGRPPGVIPEIWSEPPPVVGLKEDAGTTGDEDTGTTDEVDTGTTDDVDGSGTEGEPPVTSGSVASKPPPNESGLPKRSVAVKPRVVTMASIARRAAAAIKKECKINPLSGTATGKVSIQFTVDMATGKVLTWVGAGPVPTLTDRACVTRLAHTLVTDFSGAADLRANFVHSYDVVR
jgi:serine/threonine protein kinase